jgi:kynurenine formamidase
MDFDGDDWTELSHPIDEDTVRMPFLPAPETELVPDAALQATKVTIATHVGTHIEAPRHRFPDGDGIEAYPPERWLTEGYVAGTDVAGLDPIEPADLALPDWLGAGDALLVRTGFEERVGTGTYFDPPYLAVETAELLVERGLSWVGFDTPSPERPADIGAEGSDYPVHATLLGGDVLVGEHLTNLAGLVGERVDVVALPLRYVGSDAAHARVVARSVPRE